MSKRTCGKCIVCCVYPRITSKTLNKEPMTHCENLTLSSASEKNSVFYTGASSCGNCKIYPSCSSNDIRPKCCEEYKCEWLKGHGNEDDRPDKSLMLFDAVDGIENAVKAKPLEKDKEKTKEGTEIINRMSSSTKKPIIVMDFCEQRIVRIVGKVAK